MSCSPVRPVSLPRGPRGRTPHPSLADVTDRGAVAVALEKSNLGSLRDMQHKDQCGNVISSFPPPPDIPAAPRSPHGRAELTPCVRTLADPDWSNPTRPRFERPLDTIRSFEAAIYGTYSNNRASYARTGSLSSTPHG